MSQTFLWILNQVFFSYVMLFFISGIAIMNKKSDVRASNNTVWVIIGLMFLLLTLNTASLWAEFDVSRREVNYWTTALMYAIIPFVIYCEIYVLTEHTLRQVQLCIPAVLNAFVVLVLPQISGFRMFWYNEKNVFCATPWAALPFAVDIFYLLLLVLTITISFKQHMGIHILIVYGAVAFTLFAMILEYCNIVSGQMFNIMLIDIYLYYFFLMKVFQRRTGDEMAQKEYELTQIRLKLLQEQISPHFIFNALAIMKSMVWEDSQKASDVIDDFSTCLKENVSALKFTENLIPFSNELEHIKALQRIDEAGKGRATNVIYDIKESNFRLPPLTIEPLFENALLHGISHRKNDGEIRITSSSNSENYIVRVTDNGSGFDVNAETEGVGINNVRIRLKYICGGKLNIESSENGTVASVYIPKNITEDTK
ncbi:MAG: histidine kinase [Ruminococcus sp.]|nr:histidine kinase [Ruminococcus sp.]